MASWQPRQLLQRLSSSGSPTSSFSCCPSASLTFESWTFRSGVRGATFRLRVDVADETWAFRRVCVGRQYRLAVDPRARGT